MNTSERRQELLKVLCCRRRDTYKNLAHEFHVSKETIRKDIEILMCSYPLETIRGRYGGGFFVLDNYNIEHTASTKRRFLSSQQMSLLRNLREYVAEEDLEMFNSILIQFAP